MNTFGNRLKKLRTDRNMSQEELGKLLNVTKVGISGWETNRRFPDHDMLVNISDLFDVSLDYLLGRTDNPKGIIVRDKIGEDDIQIEVNKNAYPDGLTHEEVLEVLEKLKELGIDWEKYKKK